MDRPVLAQGTPSRGPANAIIVILTVIGVVASYAVRDAYRYSAQAAKRQAHADVLAVHAVAAPWHAGHPGYCPTMESLRAAGEITATSKITDPWDGVYRIECRGTDTLVGSDGPDRKRGTKDDVVVSDEDDRNNFE